MRTLLAVAMVVTLPAMSEAQEHHHEARGERPLRALLGRYPRTREASGTSWQPDATPHEGVHAMSGEWMLMAHGFANAVYDNQGGGRGDRKVFSSNMLMLMADRPLGQGTLGARGMWSLEPLTIGRKGYPLLLQTGETADGKTPLIDRQHPHDLFMELAATYSLPVGAEGSWFGYVGLPGEPALGPPAFMHRFSGIDNPEAPLTHHWLDSTHISFGVGTLGYIWKRVKLEGSVFTGREPDEDRWDIEAPRFDSSAARVSYNPTPAWALQASYGHLDSPEQLEPEVDTDRFTGSASYHWTREGRHWQTTAAWGRNRSDPGRDLDGFLVETLLNVRKMHTLFGRIESVEKNELFPEGDPLHGKPFMVHKASAGYLYDFPERSAVQWGIGGLGSLHFLPDRVESAYDDTPFSFMIFVRAKL
ncbi:MAG: hypothetical protein HYT90_00240 [Candidatus Omnitrophica bacterium]|nr:hypothetical protein [Candidatus Omnitrophota bacterium]